MKKTLFQGMATALITPMTPEGIDYDTLGRLIEFQIESGINAFDCLTCRELDRNVLPCNLAAVGSHQSHLDVF